MLCIFYSSWVLYRTCNIPTSSVCKVLSLFFYSIRYIIKGLSPEIFEYRFVAANYYLLRVLLGQFLPEIYHHDCD